MKKKKKKNSVELITHTFKKLQMRSHCIPDSAKLWDENSGKTSIHSRRIKMLYKCCRLYIRGTIKEVKSNWKDKGDDFREQTLMMNRGLLH